MRILFGLLTASLLSACGGSSGPAGVPSSPAAAATSRPTARSQEICIATSSGANFYLLVTSASEHDFRACSGDPLYAGTLSDLLTMPTVDRRCLVDSNASVAHLHAVVAVYSDQGNLKAANNYCQTLLGP